MEILFILKKVFCVLVVNDRGISFSFLRNGDILSFKQRLNAQNKLLKKRGRKTKFILQSVVMFNTGTFKLSKRKSGSTEKALKMDANNKYVPKIDKITYNVSKMKCLTFIIEDIYNL